jgi:hypothetical protein
MAGLAAYQYDQQKRLAKQAGEEQRTAAAAARARVVTARRDREMQLRRENAKTPDVLQLLDAEMKRATGAEMTFLAARPLNSSKKLGA